MEKEPGKVEFLNGLFRDAHTLKSMAATMEYNQTARLCHQIEDVLDAIKKKKIKLESCADALFESFDSLEMNLMRISEGKEEYDADPSIQRLQTLLLQDKEIQIEKQMDEEIRDRETEKVQSIEVKVERLDRLMNLSEELLINQMRLDRIKKELRNPELNAAIDALRRLVAEIQYNVMQSRMVPVGFVFNRFPRMVRDLAKSQKKEVDLKIEGADIELDRSVIDEIGESLVHLLRNAVDHGIETPQERKKAGKPAQGTIRLVARRTKSSAVIEIAEDGAGLNFENIKKTAMKRGILSPQASREDITNSIFYGVSTAKKVTDVSGRGFGLNICKKKIESLGGTIRAESEMQKGTTFTIEIPLTLAIIKTLFVEVGVHTYAIPIVNVERLVTVGKANIKAMMGHEAIILDKGSIPITRLDVLFGQSVHPVNEDVSNNGNAKQPIVIIRKGHEKLGLAVDNYLTVQEIVIKPLGRLIRGNKYLAGSTIIGSGEVVLILDVASLMLTKRNWEGGTSQPSNVKNHDIMKK